MRVVRLSQTKPKFAAARHRCPTRDGGGRLRHVAGYSGTRLADKLGIREGFSVAILSAPPGVVLDLPPRVKVRRQARGAADVVLAFFDRQATLDRRLPGLASMIFPSGGLWIAWPKRSSGLVTDLSDHVVRGLALPRGLVDNKVCAIDETWSALRFVWRVEHRGVPRR
jgi:hypothetical protein